MATTTGNARKTPTAADELAWFLLCQAALALIVFADFERTTELLL